MVIIFIQIGTTVVMFPAKALRLSCTCRMNASAGSTTPPTDDQHIDRLKLIQILWMILHVHSDVHLYIPI